MLLISDFFLGFERDFAVAIRSGKRDAADCLRAAHGHANGGEQSSIPGTGRPGIP